MNHPHFRSLWLQRVTIQGDHVVGAADPVTWEVCRVVVADRVPEDQETLDAKLAEGWEPFAAAVGPGGHHWYLRRGRAA